MRYILATIFLFTVPFHVFATTLLYKEDRGNNLSLVQTEEKTYLKHYDTVMKSYDNNVSIGPSYMECTYFREKFKLSFDIEVPDIQALYNSLNKNERRKCGREYYQSALRENSETTTNSRLIIMRQYGYESFVTYLIDTKFHKIVFGI